MLKHIIYTFPNDTPSGRNFFKQLTKLLAELPCTHIDRDGNLTVTPSQPVGALPVTVFKQSNVLFPQLHLDTSQELSLAMGNFHINPDKMLEYSVDGHDFDRVTTENDAFGEYFKLQFASESIYRLAIDELAKRLTGHVVRIDHTGINMPSALISNEVWQQFTHKVARQANLYNYPTNDIWPFILPATEEEFKTNITQFPMSREPKLELVYETYDSNPTIQIDIETDLTRKEVERLFPEPYGLSFPEVADFFRSVYVHHEWLGLAIRFDIRFKSEEISDWDTGKWLVEAGGRINPKQ